MPPETASPAHHVLRAEFLKQAVEMPPWFSHIANCAMASGAVKCASSDDYLDKGRDGGLRTEPRLFSGRPLMRPAIYSKCDVSPRGHTLEGKVLYCTVTDPGPWELEEPARVMRKHRTREPVNHLHGRPAGLEGSTRGFCRFATPASSSPCRLSRYAIKWRARVCTAGAHECAETSASFSSLRSLPVGDHGAGGSFLLSTSSSTLVS